MASHENVFEAAQRARWLRPDAYRWIRPDAARFLIPGTDPHDVFPALQRKFNPDQPRVPAGNPDGGQWTDGGGGINDPRVLSDATPDGIRPYEQYAQNLPDKRPVDLREEEARGGHALRKHVGKTDEELLASTTIDRGDSGIYRYARKADGSFDSVESANDFVNRTLEQNRDQVEAVASGQSADSFVTYRFGYKTGREAFRGDIDEVPYRRDTYGVGVSIVHDPRAARGFSVITAYPRNERRK
ncbi:MAG: hypothetical protein NTAFB05_16810 [Nitrobacter sp.]|uniref:RNase A-like domain-containing protein n=1 Tax=Nitrobacter sp. TaxID=29420 RepID=UPI00387DEDE9